MDTDFGVKTVFYLGEIPVTQTIVATWGVMAILVILALVTRFSLKKIPGKLQLFMELIIDGVHWLVDSSMGKDKRGFAPYVLTLALFLVLANLSGLVGVRQPTADLNTTFALALITFIMIHYNGIRSKGPLLYFKGFFQPIAFLFPMNIISELALPISLSFRLFGNMLGGVIILALMYSFAPAIAPIIGHLYFDLFAGIIQSFIFVMLTITFISLAMD